MTIHNSGAKSLIHGILTYFDGVKQFNGYYKCKCPAHRDEQASLSIREEHNAETGLTKVRLKCHAGCKFDDVLKGAELKRRDLYRHDTHRRIIATYDYTSLTGELLHQTVRFEPKDFSQRRPNGQGGWVWSLRDIDPVLYNLPAVMRAILEGETILLVEGEKDADRATAELGLVATTCPMGAESWRAAYTKMLHDARVVLIPDNDRAGRQHMDNVGRDLLGVAKSVKRADLPNLPDKGDLSDWIDAGGTREALLSIIEQAPEFEGHPNPRSLSGGGFGGRFRWFGQMGQPKPQEFLADPAAPKAFPLMVHGAGGSAKSYLTVLLAMIHASPAGGSWLGSSVKGGGRALVVDFELNEDVFNYRVRRLAKGVGIDPSTISGLAYYEVGDQGTKEAFDEVYRLCREHNFDLVIIDSVGPALEGDASSSRDVIQFHRNRISSLTALGVTPALIDHQARAYSDEDYQARGAFGSGYKEHLARSVFQVHPRPPDTNSDTLVVRVRHKKANFTKLMKPFDVWLTFSEESVRVERHDVDDDSLLKEQAISLESRILSALRLHEKGTVSDLTDWLGANRGSVDNAVRLLRKQGRIIEVGKEGNATVYSLPEETSTATPPKEYGGGGLKSVPKFLTDQDQVGDLAERAPGAVHVALDLEGDLDAKVNRLHRESGIRVLSVHLAGETHLLDLRAVDPTPLLKVLEDIPIYVHGAEFDIAALHHCYGFVPKHVPRDTLNLSRLVYAGEEISHSLLDCLERELGDETTTEEDRKAKQKFQKPKAWQEELTEEHARYAAGDVDRLAELYEALFEEAGTRGLEEIVKQENRARPAFLDMQFNGVKVDTERWIRACDALVAELDDLRARLHERLPDPPDEEGWKLDGSGAKRGPKVALAALGYEVKDVQVATLRHLAKKVQDPIVDDLVLYREKSGSLKYVDWPERFFVNGRIHPIINPHGAEDTGRATTSSPNLQGLDKGGEWRRYIRPGPGRKIIRADLAQIELRIIAYVSGDRDLFDALHRGDDIHKMTAEAAVGRELDLEVKEDYELRSLAKRVNFGRFYGAGPQTITKNLNDKGVGVSEKEVRKILKGLADAFPRVAKWQNEFGNRPEFVVKSVMGRRRRVGGFNGKPKYTERLNGPVQTSGTDILKTALGTLVDERGDHPEISIVLAIHDEVLLEAPAGEKAEEAKVWLEGALRGAVHDILGPKYVGVPREKSDCAEANIQDSWGGD